MNISTSIGTPIGAPNDILKDRPSRIRRWKTNVERFFLMPASPLPLAVLRISLATLLIVQAYLLRNSVIPFFSRSGLIQGPLADVLRMPGTPHVGWLSDWLAPFGVSEIACLYGVCSAYLVSVVLFGLGLFTRPAAIATWFLHWVLMITGFSSIYGVDLYAHVFLFYLMWMPAGDALSLDAHYAQVPLTGIPSVGARLGLRVMQLHLCISYFGSAIEKSHGVQWRTGEVLWRAMSLPLYSSNIDMKWLAHWPSLLFIGSWSTLVLEGGYFIFIWPKATRKLWILGMLGLHFGIAIFLGLHLFGAIMGILSVSLFGFSAEPVPILAKSPIEVSSCIHNQLVAASEIEPDARENLQTALS
jgi:hypothetical protein